MSFRVPMNAGAQRKACRTPRRERPAGAAAPQDANVPIEFVLEDASQFPQLPDGGTMVRGRKARRSHTAWGEQGVPVRTQSLSRERRPVINEAEERVENSRARAYSYDAGVEALAEKEAPTTPRSCLKKKERTAPAVDLESEGLLEQMARLQRQLMAKGLDQAEVGLKLNMKISSMPLDPEPTPAATASSSAETAEEQEAAPRPRRLSNPGPGVAFELPTGNSWDFPLAKTEKQARFAMISSHEIEYLEDANAALEEAMEDLKRR